MDGAAMRAKVLSSVGSYSAAVWRHQCSFGNTTHLISNKDTQLATYWGFQISIKQKRVVCTF